MSTAKLEYIWLDGYVPTQNMRSKTKMIKDFDGKLESCPVWAFDGSSTQQAEGGSSDCLLKPVSIFPDPTRENGFLVMTEVMNPDGSPHPSNGRATIDDDDDDFWFGFEQEYFIMDTDTDLPLGFPPGGYPGPQGLYYCGVGGNQVRGRELVESHLKKCLDMGIVLTGVNAEVAVGQWEFQCFSKDTLKACDDLWVSRYVLFKMAEDYGYDIDIRPKPVTGDWNGSGCHTNFSNHTMRTASDKEYFISVLSSLENRHILHISSYGEDNHKRLTGLHETQSIDQFSYGVSDRGASIRIPVYTVEHNWNGYLEDRRPASNADPYKILSHIVGTLTK